MFQRDVEEAHSEQNRSLVDLEPNDEVRGGSSNNVWVGPIRLQTATSSSGTSLNMNYQRKSRELK